MYSKKCLALLAVLGMSSLMPSAVADVVLIANPSVNVTVDKATLKKIYLGRVKALPNGQKVTPVDMETEEVKKEFLKSYLHKEQSAIDSYWSRMIFTGAGMPPKSFKNAAAVKAFVSANEGAIGYIDRSELDDTVKLLQVN